MSAVFLFVDTNVFLHYRGLDQIDWCCLTKAKSVLIVLPPVVFRELNKQKDTNPSRHLRKRAQVALVSLGKLFKTGVRAAIRPGVDAEFMAHDPLIDFAAHQLRTDMQDDFLLASILDYRARNSGSDCRLVTADVGLNLKSRPHNIPVLSVPEELKLPDEVDSNEKRVKDLEAEIQELKHRAPSLRLCFENESDVAKFTLAKPVVLVSSDVDCAVHDLTRKYPKTQLPSEMPLAKHKQGIASKTIQEMIAMQNPLATLPNLRSRIPPEAIRRYNDQLDEFYSDYRGHLEALPAQENLKLRTICLKILMLNNGTSPAEDIDVLLHFPDGFQMFDQEHLPQAPTPPEPPDTPRTDQQTLQDRLADFGASLLLRPVIPSVPNSNPPANVSSPSIQRTNSYTVDFQVRKLKHGFREAFEPIYLMFDTFEAASSFQIDYVIHAGNMPKPVGGKLHVVVERDAPPS